MAGTKIVGWIGPAGSSYVSGWILDKNDEKRKLNVTIEVNGVQLKPVQASASRKHLLELGYKHHRHGFRVYIPDDVLAKSPGPIRMWDSANPATVIEARDQFPPLTEKSQPRLLTIIESALEERTKPGKIDFDKMAALGSELISDNQFMGILLSAGRGCIYNREYDKGMILLGACRHLFPNNYEALFYMGVLLSNSGEPIEALEHFEELQDLDWKPQQTLLEYAKALVRAIDKSGHKADEDLKKRLISASYSLSEIDDGKVSYPPNLPLRLAHSGEPELALEISDRLIARRPGQPQGMANKSRILIEQGRYDEGLELSREILRNWPGNEVAQYHLRVYSNFSDSEGLQRSTVFAMLETREAGPIVRIYSEGSPTEDTLSVEGAIDLGEKVDWIFMPNGTKVPNPEDWQDTIKGNIRTGCVDATDGSGTLWRSEVLQMLFESDLLDLNAPLQPQLEKWHGIYCPRAHAAPRRGGNVLLISRYGTSKFGGAEHTMASLSAYYRESGRNTVLAGTDASVTPDEQLGPNQFGDRIPADATALRSYILKKGFDVVHAISGMGFQVAQALAYSNITMVYGIYFWRDVLGREGLETFFDDEDAPIPREEFKYILQQAHTVFVNSKYTRSIIEQAHSIRLPIVYSIPEELNK